MIEKIDASQIQDCLGKSPARQPDSANAAANDNTDVSLEVNSNCLISKAIQNPDSDTQAVEQARQLLLSGRLDSPENIREAAENIINLGI